MALVVRADLQARLSPESFKRLYARNGGPTVDTTFADLMLAEAESEFLMMCEATFPDGFTAPVDVAIVGAICAIANQKAALGHLSATEASGYDLAGRRAREFAARLAGDDKNRPSNGQVSRPTALPVPVVAAPFWSDPNDPSAPGSY